jgi:NADH-quinone oxidoreductase subunit L
MVTRVSPIIVQSHTTMIVIAAIGTFTAIFAATIALTQNDIKKVLAYSTVSQLGYMFLGCGVGAFTSGMFHVTTHAFFKALLFLGAGSVIHAMHHEQDMRKMGGLAKKIPITYWTMVMGWLAISGIPPWAGFWSKDEVLGNAYGFDGIGKLLYVVGIITAALTAFYMSRLMWKTFWTDPRFNEAELGHVHGHATAAEEDAGHGHADGHAGEGAEDELAHAANDHGHGAHAGVHESPPTMTLPLIVLGVLSIVGGLVGLPHGLLWGNAFERFLEPSVPPATLFKPEEGLSPYLGMGIGFAAGLIGIGIAYALYSKRRKTGEILTPEEKAAPTLVGQTYRGSVNLWGFDSFATWLGIDLGGSLARTSAWIDRNIVDGLVNGVAGITGISSEIFRRAQTGFVRSYALVMLFGVCLVIASILWPIISHH